MKLRAGLAFAIAMLAISATAVAATDPNDPQERLNAADNTAARRAVVTLADLSSVAALRGGWKSELAKDDPTADDECAGRPDLSDLTVTGKGLSRDFTRGDGSFLASESELYESPAQLRASFRRSMNQALVRCFHKISVGESDAKFKITVVSGRRVSAPRIGDVNARYRLLYNLTERASGNTLKVNWDLYFVGEGRTAMSFVFVGLGKPMPAAAIQAVVRRVAARATSA